MSNQPILPLSVIMQLVKVATLTHCTAVPHTSTSTQLITLLATALAKTIAVQRLEKNVTIFIITK